MSRMPWEWWSTRATHAQEGGDELHGDVMRFLAILALCLAAIFAVVRTTPSGDGGRAETGPPPPAPRTQPLRIPEPARGPRAEHPAAKRPGGGDPLRTAPLPRPPAPAASSPAREAAQTSSKATPTAEKPEADPGPGQGFTLRFYSDTALRRLVIGGQVAVYARWQGQAYRMRVERGLTGFQPAPLPEKLHEMEPATVPPEVTAALAGTLGKRGAQASWGAELSSTIYAGIRRLTDTARAGALVIHGDGRVSLSPAPEEGAR